MISVQDDYYQRHLNTVFHSSIPENAFTAYHKANKKDTLPDVLKNNAEITGQLNNAQEVRRTLESISFADSVEVRLQKVDKAQQEFLLWFDLFTRLALPPPSNSESYKQGVNLEFEKLKSAMPDFNFLPEAIPYQQAQWGPLMRSLELPWNHKTAPANTYVCEGLEKLADIKLGQEKPSARLSKSDSHVIFTFSYPVDFDFNIIQEVFGLPNDPKTQNLEKFQQLDPLKRKQALASSHLLYEATMNIAALGLTLKAKGINSRIEHKKEYQAHTDGKPGGILTITISLPKIPNSAEST